MSTDSINYEELKKGNFKERLKYNVFFSKFSRQVVRKESRVSTESKYVVYFPYAANKWFIEGNGIENTSQKARKTIGTFDIASTISNTDIILASLGVLLAVYYPQMFMGFVILGFVLNLLLPYLILEKGLKLSKFKDEFYNYFDGDIGKYILSSKTERYHDELTDIQKTSVLQYFFRAYPEIIKYKTRSYALFYWIYTLLITTILYKYGMVDFAVIYLTARVFINIKNAYYINKYIEIYESIIFDITDYFVKHEYDENKHPIIKINVSLQTVKDTSVEEVKSKLKMN